MPVLGSIAVAGVDDIAAAAAADLEFVVAVETAFVETARVVGGQCRQSGGQHRRAAGAKSLCISWSGASLSSLIFPFETLHRIVCSCGHICVQEVGQRAILRMNSQFSGH